MRVYAFEAVEASLQSMEQAVTGEQNPQFQLSRMAMRVYELGARTEAKADGGLGCRAERLRSGRVASCDKARSESVWVSIFQVTSFHP